MGHTALSYKQRVQQYLAEAHLHLERIDAAFAALAHSYDFLLDEEEFAALLVNPQHVAFADQIIYRFSKAQDTMGAKLFKTFLLYQGENVDRPFRDILNELEGLHILEVEGWFILRELRNEIAHHYAGNEQVALRILNGIYTQREMLRGILARLEALAE
jgi:hypothetical protein